MLIVQMTGSVVQLAKVIKDEEPYKIDRHSKYAPQQPQNVGAKAGISFVNTS